MAKSIFVVEDDPHILEVVCEYLKESGFIVFSVASGQQAIDTISSNPDFSLFVLDIMLPEVSGIDILKFIRETENYSKTPVIMLTALADETTQLNSFDSLADDYVTKPFSPKILIKRVEALLRLTSTESKKLTYHDISVDCESYQILESGKPIKLTFREFEILKTLLSNPNKVYTRQQLLNHSWGYDYFGDERIVDVHIKNLRKKFKTSIISTVKGVGYKISSQES